MENESVFNEMLREDRDLFPGNDELCSFYTHCISDLRGRSLVMVPADILKDIAWKLEETLPMRSDWMKYGWVFGLEDNKMLTKLHRKAECTGEYGTYLAFMGPLQDKSFAHVLQVLMNEERVDVLQVIRSRVEEFLRGNAPGSTNSTQSFIPCEPSAPEYESSSGFDSSSWQEQLQRTAIQKPLPRECFKSQCEEDAFQKNSVAIKNANFIDIPGKYLEKNSHSPFPLMDPQFAMHISVFIPHCDVDIEIAQKLSHVLRTQYNFIVRTLFDLDYLQPISVCEPLSFIINEVDFIVPVLSKTFIQQIRAPHDSELLSEDAKNNRYIFQLLQNELWNNRSRNMRVKPVMVPQMEYHLIMNDLLLRSALKLWDCVPKFVDRLAKTKPLLKN